MAAVRLRAAALVLCGALAYANALTGPFVFDDRTAIVDNATIRAFGPGALVPPLETPVAGRPVPNLTLAANYAVGGLDVRGYHAVNVLLHLLAGLLVASVVRRTLLLPGFPDLFGSNAAALSWAAAMLWLVHPLHTEVVNYTTQRTESLMAIALLATLGAAIRARETGRPGWSVTAVLFCALGMACKETMAVAPVLVVLYDALLVHGSLRRALVARWRLYAGLAGTWLVLGALMWAAPRSTVGVGTGVGVATYLLNQAEIVGRYLALVVSPRALVVDYGLPRPLTIADVWLPAAVIAALALATVLAVAHGWRAGFLGVWFFLTLAPTSSVIPIASEVGAERRMYVPLIAIAVLVVAGGCAAVAGIAPAWVRDARPAPSAEAPTSRPRRGRGAAPAGRPGASLATSTRLAWPAALAIALAGGLLAWGTRARNEEYREARVLAETVVNRRPHGRARFWLADELVKAGDRDRAIAELRLAVADYPQAHFGLATELAVSGAIDEAATHVREFLRLVPESAVVPAAHDLLGRLLASQDRLDDAAAEFEAVLRANPRWARAAVALGDVRFGQRRYADAAAAYERARAEQPGSPDISGKLGRVLFMAGRSQEALPHLRSAAAARPDDALVIETLGRTLGSLGRFAEAAEAFRQLVALVPDHPEATRLLERAAQLARVPPVTPAGVR